MIVLLIRPWMAFQRYEDPPRKPAAQVVAGRCDGNRRTGHPETIVDEYRRAGVEGSLENKLRNFLTMVGGNPLDRPPEEGHPFGDILTEVSGAVRATAEGRFALAVSKVREIRYWHLLWTLGILLLALPLIAVGRLRGHWRDDDDWRFAGLCLAVCGIGALVWGLLMFGNEAGRAILITASLALPLLGIVGVVAGLRATYPSLVGWFVGANVVTVLILYVPMIAPVPNNSYSGFAAVAAAASLAGFIKLAFSSFDRSNSLSAHEG